MPHALGSHPSGPQAVGGPGPAPGAMGVLDALSVLGDKLQQQAKRIPGATRVVDAAAFVGRGLREVGNESGIPEAKALSLMYDFLVPGSEADLVLAAIPLGRVVSKTDEAVDFANSMLKGFSKYVDPWARTRPDVGRQWAHFIDDEFPLVNVLIDPKGKDRIVHFGLDRYNQQLGRKAPPAWLDEFLAENESKIIEAAKRNSPGLPVVSYHVDPTTGDLIPPKLVSGLRERAIKSRQ